MLATALLRCGSLVFGCMLALSIAVQPARGADKSFTLHRFERIPLTDVYYSEGANFGDLNRDGAMDVIYGPYWYAGPDFKKSHEIYAPVAQPREAYADHFFCWAHDFNGDGLQDVLTVGLPGTPAYVYQHPGMENLDQHWPKHEVFKSVGNESPQFVNLTGDERPELVCVSDGALVHITWNPDQPFAPWKAQRISDVVINHPFMHGLGVGDIDGDGRSDVITKDGWYRQPESPDGNALWAFSKFRFAERGGADMHAYDVDGDGDNDVITSLAAHEYGLSWFEQLRDGDRITFREHRIMGEAASDNRYGIVFTELHSVALADIDGDGLKDIVTGKTYWSHHTQSPLWDAGAVVYWFQLRRTAEGVEWIPHQADGESGIGRQCIVGDVTGDQLPDIVVGGMKGSHVLRHHVETVDETAYKAAQPQPFEPLAAGLLPEQAARQMEVPEGFQVQLAAGEPMVHQPVAMAFDHRGRLWVAEAHTYPTRAPEGEGRDKILIFEDADHDGVFDSHKVFADGLNLISGLEVGFGGVWVGAAPYLLFLPDRDGDDRPDGPAEVLLDGFGYDDTHETLNTFIWGPDGWLYGCHGVFTHSRVGKPGTADEHRVPMNAAVWRYHPMEHRFEVFAWGTSNPWGVDFNDRGQAFTTACVIPHLFHVIQGARYQRQAGNHFDAHVYGEIHTIADHAHYSGNIGDHAWWGKEPELPQSTSAAGGGHAHCGAMIYLGDNWPDAYRDTIFMNNIHGNRVNNDRLQSKGSGYIGSHGPDFLFAHDKWFRGINLRYGPDGTVYLIDWYDRNACHRVNPEIWDRTNGRIYRISYGDVRGESVDLSQLTSAELVELQTHRNDWFVRTARRLLQERGADEAVHAALNKLLADAETTPLRLRALWALHVTNGLNDDAISELLRSPDEYVRAWTIQLQLEDRQLLPAHAQQLAALAVADPSPVVRLYLSSALQRLEGESRWQVAEALAMHSEDAEDENLPLMYWYGTEPLVTQDPARALRLAATTAIPTLRRFIVRRAAAENDLLGQVAALLSKTRSATRQQEILEEMLHAFEGRVNIPMPETWQAAYDVAQASSETRVRELAEQVAVVLGDRRIFPKMRDLLADAAAPLDGRRQALEILVRGRDAEAAAAMQAALATPPLRSPALRALAAFDDPQVPQSILAVYDELSADERSDAIATLVARPSSAMALLSAVQSGRVPRTDVHAYHVRQLLEFHIPELEEAIQQSWGDIRATSADKQQRITQLKQVFAKDKMTDADAGRGRLVFDRTCASCHTLFGQGGKIGPDITGSNRADLDYILENIIDPSAVLGKDYRMTVLNTADGRVISGLVQKETESALTIRTINDTVVVAQEDIEERQLSNLSLMPEGLLDSLAEEESRHLLAYLASPTQVAPRGPRSPIDAETGKVPDALEGETLKVLGTTGGEAQGQNMSAFTKDRWSNNDHLWWTGAKPDDQLDLGLPVDRAGTYELEVALTRARDYGIVQLLLDGVELGGPIDLFNTPDVVTTGVLTFESRKLDAGDHTLSVKILGAHPKAVPAYMFGLDYVRLRPVEGTAVAE